MENLSDLIYIGLLVLFLIVLKLFSRPFVGLLVRLGIIEVGKMAMAKQPDRIRMVRSASAFKDAKAARVYAEPLLALGFADAGTYSVDTLPGVLVRFFSKPKDNLYAVIYEHAKAGVWMNYVSLFGDGGSITFTTQTDRGLEQRPEHPITYAPGAGAEELYKRALSERPWKPLKPMPPENIVPEFERAYAESMAWRKQKGISKEEVLKVMKTGRP